MKIHMILAFAAFTFGYSHAALAEDSKASPSSPLTGWEFGSYFDLYYQTSSQAQTVSPGAAGPKVLEGRIFDRHANQMVLNMIEFSARKKVGKVTFRIDAGFGEMVDVLANVGPTTTASMGNSSPNPAANEPTRNLTQANLAYAPIENLTLTVGKFYTPLGYETTKTKENLQYSRSNLCNYAIPLRHEGMSAAYGVMPGKLVGTLYIVNNLDGRLAQVRSQTPAFGAQLATTPLEALVANYVYFTAFEGGDGAGTDTVWNGWAVYAKAQLAPFYTLSPRYESYNDSDGQTTSVRQKLTSLTISNNFDLGDGLESRFEHRTDTSDKNTFFKNTNGQTAEEQDSFSVSVLYAF